MDLGRREELAHEPYLAEGGAVEMPNAADPQRPQDARLWVALDGIQDIARKAADEPPGRGSDRCWTQAQQRFSRPHPSNNRLNRGQNSAPKRAGKNKTGLRHRTILQDRRRHTAPCAKGTGIGMTDLGKAPSGETARRASDDRASTSNRVPDHI